MAECERELCREEKEKEEEEREFSSRESERGRRERGGGILSGEEKVGLKESGAGKCKGKRVEREKDANKKWNFLANFFSSSPAFFLPEFVRA